MTEQDKATGLSSNVVTIWNRQSPGTRRIYVFDPTLSTVRDFIVVCRPPELLLGACIYGPEIDMWSVGCVFAELLSGSPLFPGKDEMDQMKKISQIMGLPTEKTMPGVSRLPW